MKLKAENKVGAHQGEHCSIRITHFSGIQVRQFDARLDIIFLLVPKLRKGSSIPFFFFSPSPLAPSPPLPLGVFCQLLPLATLLGGVPSFGGEGVFNRSNLKLRFLKAVRISFNTTPVILSGAFPREDLILYHFFL